MRTEFLAVTNDVARIALLQVEGYPKETAKA